MKILGAIACLLVISMSLPGCGMDVIELSREGATEYAIITGNDTCSSSDLMGQKAQLLKGDF